MNLPKALGCKTSVTLYGPSQKNRVEEAAEEEDTSQREGYRDPRGAATTQPLRKTNMESYCTGVKRLAGYTTC